MRTPHDAAPFTRTKLIWCHAGRPAPPVFSVIRHYARRTPHQGPAPDRREPMAHREDSTTTAGPTCDDRGTSVPSG